VIVGGIVSAFVYNALRRLGTGLENRRGLRVTVGSNPTLSARTRSMPQEMISPCHPSLFAHGFSVDFSGRSATIAIPNGTLGEIDGPRK